MSLTVAPEQIVEESGSPLLTAPLDWPRRPLGEVLSIINGFAFKSAQFTQDGGTPLIRIRDIFNDHTAVNFDGPYEAKYVVHRGDLLVGMDGDFNCARWAGPQALLNQRVCKLQPKPEVLDISFLHHLLPGYLKAIQDMTSSTTVAHLSSRDLARIPFPVPPLPEQQAVARILDAVGDKERSAMSHLKVARRATHQFEPALISAAVTGRLTANWRTGHAHHNANELAQRLEELHAGEPLRRSKSPVQSAVRDLDQDELPDSWRTLPLRLLCAAGRPITYGILKPGPDTPDGVPYVRVTDFKHGHVEVADVRRTSTEIASQYQRSALASGDVLFAIRGTYGHVAVVPGDLEGGNITQDTARLSIDSRLCREYVVLALISPSVQRRVRRAAKGVAVQGINLGDLRELLIPIPPLEEQREISREVAELRRVNARIDAQLAKASVLTSSACRSVLIKVLTGSASSGSPNGSSPRATNIELPPRTAV